MHTIVSTLTAQTFGHSLAVLFATVAAAALAGCGVYGDCDNREEPLDLAVGIDEASGEVSLDWSAGDASSITVQDASGKTMWHVQCGGQNGASQGSLEASACIPSPIGYGETTDSRYFDEVNVTNPKPLASGEVYTAIVVTFAPGDSNQCGDMFSAEIEFTAP